MPDIPGDIFWFAGHTAWNADPGAIYKKNREDSMHANIGHIHKLLVIAIMIGVTPSAYADVVTDWNAPAGDIVLAAKLAPAMPYRAMAVVQSAVYEAVNAITKRYPSDRINLNLYA